MNITQLLELDNNDGVYVIDLKPSSLEEPSTPPPENEGNPRPNYTRFHIMGHPEVQCYHCKEFGHTRSSCINPHYRMRCIYCGLQDHTAFNCKLVVCFKCLGVGHKIAECRTVLSDRCGMCKRPGHSTQNCLLRVEMRRTAEAQLTCLNCRTRGHCNCFEGKAKSRSVYCSWCGERGHIHDECKEKVRRGRFV